MTIFIDMQARMVACILSKITLDMDKIVISKRQYFKNHSGTRLLFPSLIIELCRRTQEEEYAADTRLLLGPHILPLKLSGEGFPIQSKKRNMDFDKSS